MCNDGAGGHRLFEHLAPMPLSCHEGAVHRPVGKGIVLQTSVIPATAYKSWNLTSGEQNGGTRGRDGGPRAAVLGGSGAVPRPRGAAGTVRAAHPSAPQRTG